MPGETRIDASLTLHDFTGELRVEAVTGHDEVSRNFEYAVDVQAEELDLEALISTTAVLTMHGPEGTERVIHGVVCAIDVNVLEARRSLDLDSYRIVLRPLTHLLSLRHGFKIFQKQTTIDIVKAVFAAAKLPEQAFAYRVGSYPKREYCVQYDESEWNFVCRLLEDEGIWFRFEHSETGHVMVLHDASRNAPHMQPDYLAFERQGSFGSRLAARELSLHARAHVNHVTLNDCHPLRPSTKLLVEVEQRGPFARELYEFPSGCVDPKRQKTLARARLDEQLGAAGETRARTNALSAAAGTQVTIDGHPSGEGQFFVREVHTQITLRALDPGRAVDAGPVREADCNVDLELQPLSQTFRPERRTPRPRIAGVQTARVTGPPNQEVSFDDHGRVKLQFHWDRAGLLDDNTSCFVRVAQGHTTGSMAMPRIGWEVLVEFVDGDPDRPVCLGRLYNPFFPPPANLPKERTVTMMRSESVGGAGFNQLRMDDQAGAEMLELHAQYDLNIAVANNKQLQIEAKANHGVSKNRSESVGADATESYEANVSHNVTGDQSVSVAANRTLKVSGNATEEIGGNFTRTVGATETVHVGSLSAALIQLLTSEAIAGAVGAAAKAAERMGARALGPLMPALSAARESLGAAAKLAGPAAALLSGGDASATAFGALAGAVVSADAALSLDTATAMATAAATAELAPGIGKAVGDALGVSGGGGGGSGGGASSAGPAAAGGGAGNWTTAVGGNVSETVGGLVAISSAQGITQGVAGNRSELIGAARIEAIKGGRVEETGAAKAETVGVYTVKADQDITIDAGAAGVINISGALTQKIGGSHTISGKKETTLTTSKLELKSKASISFVCGVAKMIVDGKGITLSGLQKITIEGNNIEMDPVDIGPG